MKFTDENGNQFNGIHVAGTVTLNDHGWILTPLPKEYRIGPIVLVGEGEPRQVDEQEFFFNDANGRAEIWYGERSMLSYTILKPVRVEDTERLE